MSARRYNASVVVVNHFVQVGKGNLVLVVAGIFQNELRVVDSYQPAKNRITIRKDGVKRLFLQNVLLRLYFVGFNPHQSFTHGMDPLHG